MATLPKIITLLTCIIVGLPASGAFPAGEDLAPGNNQSPFPSGAAKKRNPALTISVDEVLQKLKEKQDREPREPF